MSLRASRRRYRRMTVRLRAVYLHAGVSHAAIATTLGAGGLFVATDEPLPRGSELRIAFCVPGSLRSHELDARVVWSHRPGDPGQPGGHGMGLAFTNPAACATLAHELDALPAGTPIDPDPA